LKRILRTLQTYAPGVRPLKFGLYNAMTRHLGWHVEIDFKLLSRLPKPALAVDIGGNWGQSIEALKRTARPGKIVSFEPNPVLGKRLSEVYANDEHVQIERCGLGDTSGGFTLYVPNYNGFIYDGLASLDEAEARNWLNPDSMAFFDPKKLVLDKYDVPIKTLDSYGLTPDIVKIDVQGLEPQVVRGGLETFRRAQPVTIIETPSADLVALLASLGLDAYRWTGERLVAGDTAGLNTLFLSRERVRQLGLA
jgi:FkbM family methyltransferase